MPPRLQLVHEQQRKRQCAVPTHQPRSKSRQLGTLAHNSSFSYMRQHRVQSQSLSTSMPWSLAHSLGCSSCQANSRHVRDCRAVTNPQKRDRRLQTRGMDGVPRRTISTNVPTRQTPPRAFCLPRQAGRISVPQCTAETPHQSVVLEGRADERTRQADQLSTCNQETHVLKPMPRRQTTREPVEQPSSWQHIYHQSVAVAWVTGCGRDSQTQTSCHAQPRVLSLVMRARLRRASACDTPDTYALWCTHQ